MSAAGYIYLIQSNQFLKIGYAANLESRFKQYRQHNPHAILLASFKHQNAQMIEKQIHKKFK